jgi:hypothetical protein
LPRNDLVDAIEGASGSPFSHCGLVRSTATGWAVVEALGVVKETPLEQWIDQGRDRAVFVFRFKSSTPELLQSVVAEARKFQGRPYDSRYRMDDEAIYCSELLYKAHLNATGKPLGQTCRLGELSWKPFEDLITRIEQGPVPLDREMITPKAVAEAPELIFVGEF